MAGSIRGSCQKTIVPCAPTMRCISLMPMVPKGGLKLPRSADRAANWLLASSRSCGGAFPFVRRVVEYRIYQFHCSMVTGGNGRRYLSVAKWLAMTLPSTAWCPAGTTIETLVGVKGRRWAIQDSVETAKN